MELLSICPLCGGKDSRLFDERMFRGYKVTNWLCQHCGLVFMSPRMDASELAQFYAREYRRLYQGRCGIDERELKLQSQRAIHLVSLVRERVGVINRHLDIGCSGGRLLWAMQMAMGCQSIGIEPDDTYRKFCVSQGLTVYSSLNEVQALPSEPFDLITMSHVLEHLTDPVGYLVALRKHC